MPTLNIYKKIVAFDDANQTAAPKLQAINWNRDTLLGIPVEAPSNDRFVLPSLSSKTIFDGTVTLAYDNTSTFALTLSPLSPSRYRLSWTGGADPQFRTGRSLSLTGGSITVAINLNQTAIVTHSAGAVFGNIQVGDDIFVPGVSTGDTVLFNSLNEGHWVVLDATTTQLTLVRETGTVFEGTAEVVAITNVNQFLAYSSAGVQVDNVIGLISGFAASLLHNYEIVEVTSKFIEFYSSAPLPTQTVVPGAGSIIVYDSAKRYLYLETDQEISVTINGLDAVTIIPFKAGDSNYPGIYEISSVVYSLTITNKSTQQASVRIVSVE